VIRHRLHQTFALGHFNEGVQWVRELNEACRKAGLTEGKLWAAGFGKVNETVLEWEYPDYASYERDIKAFQSNPETMKSFRKGVGILAPDTWPWDDVIEEAPTLA